MSIGTFGIILGILGIVFYIIMRRDFKKYSFALRQARENRQPQPTANIKIKICLPCFFVFMVSATICLLYYANSQ